MQRRRGGPGSRRASGSRTDRGPRAEHPGPRDTRTSPERGARQRPDADPRRAGQHDRPGRLRRHPRSDWLLKAATTGQPGDGATVEPYTVQVENIDARTLRLSWTDYPIDNALSLFVDQAGAGLRFVLVQPAPSGPADAMGEGRILELTFDRDISAAQVESFLQEGLDTPG